MAALLLFLLSASARPVEAAGPLTLWYTQPATDAMSQALPIGNGRLGGLVFGGTTDERIVFDEDSLWTGDENPSGNYDTMGGYQTFGNVRLHLPDSADATDYRRDLDIRRAVADVDYRAGGVTYHREYFASHPAQVMVVRLTANQPGRYTGTISLDDAHIGTISVAGHTIKSRGALPNGEKYEAQLAVLHDGGTLAVLPDGLSMQGCNSVTLILGAGTDYVMNYARHYRGGDPHARVTRQVAAACARPYAALLAAHERDYRGLFDRVHADFGKSPADRLSLPTDRRKGLDTHGDDPELEALLFQYGRYLLISCSRPGGLPANLQGLWNDSNDAPWHSDYHANINVEMNYWPAEVTNLSECHLPFFDLVESQLPAWRTETAASPEFQLASGAPVRGFAIRTSHNIMGGMGWNWDKTANAWYCHHFWEHYAFTGDRHFLRTTAYPIMKETVEFWQDHLKTLPDGRIVVPNAWSPEHGPVEDGVSYAQEIVWDLFTNYIEAGTVLGVDADYRAKIAALRAKLVWPKIGRWGQLQEWMEDRDDPNDHHRHTSHLFAVYPGRQISLTKTPALAKAAAVSLLARGTTGDSAREWAYAWRTALWARLREPERAHQMLLLLLSTQATMPNLYGDHPPMQIDGNFGITAGVAEMLLQSQAGQIELLPALPRAWSNGSVTGLRARGGFTVDESWSGGKLNKAVIHSTTGTACPLRYGSRVIRLNLAPGKSVTLNGRLKARPNLTSKQDS